MSVELPLPVAEAFAMILGLADAMQVKEINRLPGLWVVDIDEHWKVSVNGQKETVDGIPPFHAAVEFNGWPAGIFNPRGGWIAAGEAANESTFIEAVRKRIASLRRDMKPCDGCIALAARLAEADRDLEHSMGVMHRIAHWLGWNFGRVETWFDGDRMMVGFRCATCGELQHVHERYGDFVQ